MTKKDLEKDLEKQKHCHCDDCDCDEHEHKHEHECDYGEDCKCEDGCECGDNCDCGEDCHCEDDCDCGDCDCEKEGDKAQEYLEALQRLQAEFENYRKRNELFAIKAKEEGIILSIEKLLPVLDSFNLAETHLTKEEFKGLSLIKEQLQTALKDLGVTKIEAKGEMFDPNFHNAILVGEDKNKKSQIVLEVLQEGYILKEKVIRHSVVKINQ